MIALDRGYVCDACRTIHELTTQKLLCPHCGRRLVSVFALYARFPHRRRRAAGRQGADHPRRAGRAAVGGQ